MAYSPWEVSAGIGATQAILGGYASVQAAKAQGKAVANAITMAGQNYQRQLQSNQEQENLLEEQTRSMLSERGLEALKAESRLRAGTSGTGLSGSTMTEAVNQTNFDKLFDSAVILGRATTTKENMAREKMSQFIAFQNRTQEYRSGISSGSGTAGAIMNSLTAGMNTVSMAYQLGAKLPTSTPTTNTTSYSQVAFSGNNLNITQYVPSSGNPYSIHNTK